MMETLGYALLEELEKDEERPRFAAQRIKAARLGNLQERLLLSRARSEGEAHRRAESAEQEALRDD